MKIIIFKYILNLLRDCFGIVKAGASQKSDNKLGSSIFCGLWGFLLFMNLLFICFKQEIGVIINILL